MAHLLLRNEDAMYDALEKGVEERGDWLYSLGTSNFEDPDIPLLTRDVGA